MDKEYLSPKSDLIFKLIFSDRRNNDILKDFLQSVLDLPESEYDRIEIVDPHLKPETPSDKMGILDVKLHLTSGKIVDIEIQVAPVDPMRERIIFYTSKMIIEQIGKGEDYDLIQKVISIVITDFELITDSKAYHNKYRLSDINTCSQFSDALEINVLELPKLPKEPDSSQLWNWLCFLKSKREGEFAMIAEKSPTIEKAVTVLKELSEDERTRLLYEEREKARRDERGRIKFAEKEGAKKQARETAVKAIQKNMSIADIADLTGLSQEEIEELSEKVKLQ
jgi:predicted transposase/invertase (TIGR01784 family)